MLRAGTYVTGMPSAISASRRSLGTGMSAVSAEPPIGPQIQRHHAHVRHAQHLGHLAGALQLHRVALAVGDAQAHRARSPAALAIARQVVESSPPESSTTALRFICALP